MGKVPGKFAKVKTWIINETDYYTGTKPTFWRANNENQVLLLGEINKIVNRLFFQWQKADMWENTLYDKGAVL